jgi:glycosyltransferase involved in cell wall biosynthesis
VDPYKPEEITAGIEKLLSDSILRDDLRKKGLLQAEKFSWKHMAEDVLKLYHEVYNNHY